MRNWYGWLNGPFRGRVRGHVAVQDPARADLHRNEDVQDTECRRDRHEEIAGYDGLGMVADEG